MIDWAKVFACFHRVVHFDHISMARHRGTYPPKYQPPSFGTELLEPRLLLSGTGLLSETVVPGDTMPVVSVAITAGRLSGEVSTEHLVMHLKLDDATGEVAADTSPHGDDNSGSLMNGASFAVNDGPLGGAIVLDGVDDYVSVDNSSDINLATRAQRTISLWFNIDDTTISSHKQVIYEQGSRLRGLNIYVHDGMLQVGGWNHLESQWLGTYLATDAITSGTWHHVALVLDAEADSETLQPSVFSAYLDGVEYGRGEGTQVWKHGGRIGIGAINGRTRFHDGAPDNSDRHAFAGQLADVRLYNRALNAADIDTLVKVMTPNRAPFAADDHYQIDSGNILTVPVAEGILRNDTDSDSDVLTAMLTSGPTHGEVTLDPGGSFQYATAAGFVGEDHFQYKASDGIADSELATVAITVTSPGGEVSTEHLVMHLRLDDAAGEVAADTSPHGDDNSGSLMNGASFAVNDGPLGGAIVLDGVDDYVSVDNSSDINLATRAQRTISLWFNIDDTTISSHKQVIYEQGSRLRGLNIYVHDGMLQVGGWNHLESQWLGTYLATDAITSGTWHHVALVLDAEADSETLQPSVFSAYLDGVEYGRGEGTQVWKHGGRIGIGAINGRTRFHDGAPDNSDRHAFAGQLADVRLYNRALNAAELASQAGYTFDLNFVPDPGIRIESGTVPEAGIDPDTGTVHLYYRIGANEYLATATDGGLQFPAEQQAPVEPGNKAFDPRCVKMPAATEDGLPVWRSFMWNPTQGYFTSLVSYDGINYQPEDGIRYDPPNTDNVGVYTAYTTGDGRVGLMYIGDKGTTNGNVRLAYSNDNGRSFQHYDDNPLGDAGTHDAGLNQRDPDAIVLDDGRVRIFTMVQGGSLAPHPGVRSVTSIHSFTSSDHGMAFTIDPDTLLAPEHFTEFDVWSLNDPSVIQLPDGRYRMYVAGLVSELPDASDARWVILSATTAADVPDPGNVLDLDHDSTHAMDLGTHRPEILATESGDFLAVVVQPEQQADGRLAKHRVYHLDMNGKPFGESFAVTWSTDDYGEPADHRAAIVGDELFIVYQSLVFDASIPPGTTGPAEQYALNQSLMLARYSLDGEELFRGPIVAHVTDFDQDTFPDHCLVPLDDSLLVSTGSKDRIKFREINYQGEVLDAFDFSTSEIRSLSSIGNSLLLAGDRLQMFVASGMDPGGPSGISVLELDSKFQPTELAWLFHEGEERTFPTGNLQYKGYTLVTYDQREAQDTPVGPEDVPFQPRLMVLDEHLNLAMDIAIGSGEGFAHVHPTMAIVEDTLVIGWSMRAEDVDRRAPQVQIERYSLQFVSGDDVRDSRDLAAGTTRLVIQQEIDGVIEDRVVIVHAPDDLESDQVYPIVFALHGNGGDADSWTNTLATLVNDGQFIGVYPQGHEQSWNLGQEASHADDVAFVSTIISTLTGYDQIDLDRMFALGTSNGGGMVQELAVKTSHFKAIASISTQLRQGHGPATDTAPVSVLQIHGDQDPIIPYKGGGSVTGHTFLPAEDSAATWAAHNGIADDPVITQTDDGNLRFFYGPNDIGVEVIHYKMVGHGHGGFDEQENGIFDLIWQFFKSNPSFAPGGGQTDTGDIPPWVPSNASNAPWWGNLVITGSEDGLQFSEPTPFLEHAGVPNLLRTSDGQLIATYQYFSFENEALFGIMAYSTSNDDGNTWEGPLTIGVENLPALQGESQLVDPSLVELDDGTFRLYFTIHPEGLDNAHTASAIAHSIGDVFQYEGPCITLAGVNLLDPAVIEFDGLWHYYTPKPGAEGRVNLHAVSTDGKAFAWAPEISLEMNMLGNPLAVEGGIRFYGTGADGVVSAFSQDGYTWTCDYGVHSAGKDPGVVQRNDGSYILVSTIRSPEAPGGGTPTTDTDWFVTGQDADAIIAAQGFDETGDKALFNHPKGMATDGTRLLMCDGNNNRILIWTSLPDDKNDLPDLVLGQSNFNSNEPGTGLDEMNWPVAVSIGDNGSPLIVADTYNNRLLVWKSFPTSNGQAADYAIQGHSLAESRPIPEATTGNFAWPWGVWTDGTKLVVTSTAKSIYGGVAFGGWALVWNDFDFSNDTYSGVLSPPDPVSGFGTINTWPAADLYLQADGDMGTPRTITSNGDMLLIGDHNADLNSQVPGTGSAPTGNWAWQTFPTQDDETPDFFLTDPTANIWLQGCFSASGDLMLVGDQVHVWHSDALPSALDASIVNAIPSVTVDGRPFGLRSGDGSDIVTDGDRLYLSDYNGNRILVFNGLPESSSDVPDFAIGGNYHFSDGTFSYDNSLDDNHFVTNPEIATDGTVMFLSSAFDGKLLGWQSVPIDPTTVPDREYTRQMSGVSESVLFENSLTLVFGHQSGSGQHPGKIFFWNDVDPHNTSSPDNFWNNADPDVVSNSLGSVTFNQLTGCAIDGKYFYLSDYDGTRHTLYAWDRTSTDFYLSNPDPAHTINLGDLGFGGGGLSSDGSSLLVSGNSIVVIDIDQISDNVPLQRIAKTDQWSGSSTKAIVAAGHMFLSDQGHNRVLGWKDLDDALSGNAPDVILGAEGYDDVMPNIGVDSLFWAGDLCFDGNRLWVGEYKFSGRVVGFPLQ